MKWLISLGPKFLGSSFSGYLAIAGVAALGGLLWHYDEVKDDLRELKLQCLAQESNDAINALADDIKDQNEVEYEAAQDKLDDSSSACLDGFLFDPDS